MASAYFAPLDSRFHLSSLRLLALVCVVLLCSSTTGWGHGDLHEAISALDHEIALRPDAATLYLRRGELHRKDGDWLKAAADYDRAAALDPSLSAVDLARGALELDMGRPEAARMVLDRYIRNKPDDSAGYVARARLLRRQKEAVAAAADFARARALSREPSPELYLESAEALREAGRLDEAVAVLDQGTGRLGPLGSLAMMALDLEIALGRTDAALRRVNSLIAAAPRKEGSLYRRGAILEKVGRIAEARAAYELALAAIAAVPEYRRGTEATRALQTEIEGALRGLQP